MVQFNFPANYQYRDDIIAGLTVGAITIPQGMAFALLVAYRPFMASTALFSHWWFMLCWGRQII